MFPELAARCLFPAVVFFGVLISLLLFWHIFRNHSGEEDIVYKSKNLIPILRCDLDDYKQKETEDWWESLSTNAREHIFYQLERRNGLTFNLRYLDFVYYQLPDDVQYWVACYYFSV